MSPQRLTMLVFLLQPIAFGAWLPRIPDMAQQLDLGPQALALSLLGLPTGTLLTLPFAGRLVGQIGAKTTIFYGFFVYLAATALPGWAFSPASLFAALVVQGSALSTLELGLNVHAADIEKATGKQIMSTSHGFWSLGIMIGSLIGSFLAGLGMAVPLATAGVAIVCLPLSIVAALALPDIGSVPPATSMGGKTSFRLPSPLLLAICLFTFGIAMTEGAVADWSALLLRSNFGAEPATSGLGYSVFAFLVAGGRFGGDILRRRLGPVTLARICGVCAIIGLGAVLAAPTTVLAIAGFGLVGVGVSVGFPLGVSAAAGLGDQSSASSVATLSFLALIGFLVGPPMIGFVAEHFGLKVGLATLLPVLVLSLLMTAALRPGPAATPAR